MSDAAVPSVPVAVARPRAEGRAALGLRWLLVAILAAAPLPLASARPLAWSMLALASALLLSGAIACEFTDQTPARAFAPLRLPIVLAAMVGSWIAFQSMHLDLRDVPSDIWRNASRVLQDGVLPSISLDRTVSAERSLRLLAYAAVFLAAWRISRRADQANAILRAIAWIVGVYSLYGLVVYLSGNQTILWYPKWAFKLDLTSTFVSRNAFATFGGLGFVAALALMAQMLIRHVDARSVGTAIETSLETVLRRGPWLTAALVIIGSGILFTHSRGGAMATAIGAAILIGSAAIAPSLRSPWRYSFIALGVLVAFTVFAANGTGVLRRVANTSIDGDLRLDIDSGTWQAIGDHALAGTGLGTFQFVYAPYQPQSVGLFVNLAHNDYLENILELGVPAAALFYLALLVLVWQCARGVFRRRRDAIFACTALGASALVGTDALVDFSMQMPAVAITYAAILGVGVAQSIGSRERGTMSGTS